VNAPPLWHVHGVCRTKLCVDAKTLADIINTSSGRCWSSDTYNPCPGVMPNVPSSRGYTGGFGTALMLKDMNLASDAAKSIGAPLPTGDAARKMFETLRDSGYATKDFSSVFEYLSNNTRR
jgi:3-hydroxyisobutyrate dehydrogenase